MAEAIIIFSILFLAYTYFGYAFVVFGISLFTAKAVRKIPIRTNVSIVIAVWNEEKYIERKIRNILGQTYPSELIEIVFVSDGSSDKGLEIARRFSRDNILCLELTERRGKAAAVNLGVAAASGEIIVLTDARQLFAMGALAELIANFADPEVGAVSGALDLEKNPDAVGKSFSSYWDLEKWIRKSESRIHSVMGLTGAVCAIRKELYEPMPEGTILDDVMISMRIALKGRRVVFDETAVACDDAPIEYGRELRRKIRTLTGNFQLLSFMPELLSVRKNKFLFQYFSHKITRLLAPVFMAALFISNLFIVEGIYLYTLAGQLGFYGLALAGLLMGDRVKRHAYLTVPCTFMILNYAVCMGFVNFIRKRRDVWV